MLPQVLTDVLAILANDFPNIESGGSFPSDNLEEGNIKNLVEELEGDEFKTILETLDSIKMMQVILYRRFLKLGGVERESYTKKREFSITFFFAPIPFGPVLN